MVTIQQRDLDALIQALLHRGYRVIGPTVRDEAIVLGVLSSADDLPKARVDEQGPGRYRLRSRDDDALFGHAVGPQAWKHYLYPPIQTLLRAKREATSKHSGAPGFALDAIEDAGEEPSLAFVGVRPCDVAALLRLDMVFLEGPFVEPGYARRRRDAFIVAVNCTQPAGTCFCASMQCGPAATKGFDLLLTEVIGDGPPIYLAEPGSDRGRTILADVPSRPAEATERAAGAKALADAAGRMGRELSIDGLSDLLRHSVEHPRWQQTAQRCLACGNCTMVCPTCFCSTVEDTTDLTASVAERRRRWDSCFTLDYSYIHGGSVRPSGMSRYRQWIMHKLSTWVDQFGVTGCTGCGRCITWCPVGIDLTQEATAVRNPSTESATPPREYVHG